MSSLIIRSIERLDEVRLVEELQKEVWGMQDRDVVPLTELVAVRDSGGQLIGAFDGAKLAGFVYGFVAIESGRTVHHSHLLAVEPSYRGADVGYRLKLAQRERVLAQGITRMTWTFDPLQSVNAHFNFGKLGVISDQYRINFYGDQSTSFLHRNGTDRLWVTWPLASRRVEERLQRRSPTRLPELPAEPVLEVGEDGAPRRSDRSQPFAAERVALEIPADIGSLERERPESASAWREATRSAFGEALASGFRVEEFVRRGLGPEAIGAYVLNRDRTSEDFDEHSS
jgi:predicted GNAT superfamily acetyltransferase